MYIPFASAPILCKTPRNAAEHSKERELKSTSNIFKLLLGVALAIGEVSARTEGLKTSYQLPDISLSPLPCLVT